jgi:hypothetical protein
MGRSPIRALGAFIAAGSRALAWRRRRDGTTLGLSPPPNPRLPDREHMQDLLRALVVASSRSLSVLVAL